VGLGGLMGLGFFLPPLNFFVVVNLGFLHSEVSTFGGY
jgi:hypothetical protein